MAIAKSIKKGKGFVRSNPILSIAIALGGYGVYKYFNPSIPTPVIVTYGNLDSSIDYAKFVDTLFDDMKGANILSVPDDAYETIAEDFNNDELKYIYNLFNNNYFKDYNETLTEMIDNEVHLWWENGADAVIRLRGLGLR